MNLQKAVAEIEQVYYLTKLSDYSDRVVISSFKNSGTSTVKQILKSDVHLKKHKRIIESIHQLIRYLDDNEKSSILVEVLDRVSQNESFAPSKITNDASIGHKWG